MTEVSTFRTNRVQEEESSSTASNSALRVHTDIVEKNGAYDSGLVASAGQREWQWLRNLAIEDELMKLSFWRWWVRHSRSLEQPACASVPQHFEGRSY